MSNQRIIISSDSNSKGIFLNIFPISEIEPEDEMCNITFLIKKSDTSYLIDKSFEKGENIPFDNYQCFARGFF